METDNLLLKHDNPIVMRHPSFTPNNGERLHGLWDDQLLRMTKLLNDLAILGNFRYYWNPIQGIRMYVKPGTYKGKRRVVSNKR